MHRRTWIIRCASTTPEPCALLRSRCASEVDMDESYSTQEAGYWYALFHVDRKIRLCVVERALAACGIRGGRVDGHDGEGGGREWYGVLRRHMDARDERVVAWVRAGRTQRVFGRRKRGGGGGAVAARECLQRVEEEGDGGGGVVSVGAAPSNAQGGGGGGVDHSARIGLLERAAALRDEEHARAMRAKDAEMRAVLERREEAMRRAAEAEERMAVVVAAAQQQGGASPGQRELLLSVDLVAERRRADALAARLREAETLLGAERASASALGAQRIARIRELEGDLTTLREEAGRWECGLEAKRLALVSEADALAQATAELRQLRAACAAKDALIAMLRQDALSLARAELEAEMVRREEAARAEVVLAHQDMRFKSRRWKKLNEALRDELAVARRGGV